MPLLPRSCVHQPRSSPTLPVGVFMETSLHSHDWLNHWPLVTDSTSSSSPLLELWGWGGRCGAGGEGWDWKFNPLIVNANTVRPNKLKCQSLQQRKVYCKAMKGDEVAHALKSLELPEGFQQSIFKGQVIGAGLSGYVISLRTVLWLADGEAAGWCHRG